MRIGNIKEFVLQNDQEHDFTVTVDGNAPQEDNSNVLLGCYTNIGDTLYGIFFFIEIEGEVFVAKIEVITPAPSD